MEVKRQTGKFVTSTKSGEMVRAFVPIVSLLILPSNLIRCYRSWTEQIKHLVVLDGLSTLLPDTSLFLYLYVRKEAVLSSQIEGTQSSLSDLLLFENEAAPGVPMDDVAEVSSYVAAMQHGLTRLREGFPLSLRLIREIHGISLTRRAWS
jgi:Fic family protein